jgi:excisionase family DNA binding protein
MLKPQQVAERLNCSIKTVYALIESGKLGHYRCPGVRVSEDQLLAYLDLSKRERGPAPQQRNTGPRPRLKHISL